MLVVHGADDPRTEPGELDRIRREIPTARIEMIERGGHSPHSERATAARVTAIVDDFIRSTREAAPMSRDRKVGS